MSESTCPAGQPGRSTGPRTPQGKAASSMNALKDGFRAAKLIVPAGLEEEYEAFEEHLDRAFQPKSDAEQFIFHQLLRDAWTMHRIELKQCAMSESGIDPLDDPSCRQEFDRLERYHARAKSSMRANIRELRTLQTSRILQEALPDPLGETALPPLVKPNDIIALAKRTNRNFSSVAINTLVLHTNRDRELRERQPAVEPIQFRDFLTEEEKARF